MSELFRIKIWADRQNVVRGISPNGLIGEMAKLRTLLVSWISEFKSGSARQHLNNRSPTERVLVTVGQTNMLSTPHSLESETLNPYHSTTPFLDKNISLYKSTSLSRRVKLLSFFSKTGSPGNGNVWLPNMNSMYGIIN